MYTLCHAMRCIDRHRAFPVIFFWIRECRERRSLAQLEQDFTIARRTVYCRLNGRLIAVAGLVRSHREWIQILPLVHSCRVCQTWTRVQTPSPARGYAERVMARIPRRMMRAAGGPVYRNVCPRHCCASDTRYVLSPAWSGFKKHLEAVW